MDKDKKTLSQNEIDALVGRFSETDSQPPPPAEASSPPPAVEEGNAAPPVIKKYVPTNVPEAPSEPAGPDEAPKSSQATKEYVPISAPEAPSEPRAPDEALKSLQDTVADLSQRLSRMETVVERLGNLEQNAGGHSAAHPSEQDFQAMAQQLQKLNSQVQSIMGGLQYTLGYDIGKTFTCDSCDFSNFVAVYTKCTKCGKEGWWGWWPEGNSLR